MNCPKCHSENPDDNKFCRECGAALLLVCDGCGHELQAGDRFCGQCGQELVEEDKKESIQLGTEGERKHVTVLFSDLSGYTAMAEKLDPEEVKEITGRIFGEVSKVIAKYDGFVEKYAGDAVMALFGVPKAHEDDPIRAIKAAREIHDCVNTLSPEIETHIGQTISMHSGINTGLVVTGEVDMGRGTHGVAGDTINVASRLSQLAREGEVLVDSDTYLQAEGFFNFESLEPATVKGKAQPVKVHKVLSPKDKPITIRRLSGVRADLVGRKVEIAELNEAVENLHKGKGRIFSISGDAGTGKSRLVEEFKATLDLNRIQWLEGHAHAYTQNIPYFPMMDLLNSVFQIRESDPAVDVKKKLEAGIDRLVGKEQNLSPYIGGLYSLSYPEVAEMSPQNWKSRLHEAILAILTALAQRAPSIFFLEDLHWADPSFVELLRHACLEIRQPAIVLCAYRPTFSLFKSHEISGIGKLHHEIHLQDLSLSDTQDMLESLLQSENIPSDLKRLVQSKAEGNPFYLEELVNSLIESETLIRDNGHWKITKPLTTSNISVSIHGLITGRLDRLEKETKQILQEASVIGRAFLYKILKRITKLKEGVDQSLSGLERLDLIRARSLQPELEYIFKHALTQEVVYKGLLKKERREIHERTGQVIETLFHDRLSEFYEILAFHFSHGKSESKAVDYLIRSGEKSLRRYAVDESHQYYKAAFEILIGSPQLSSVNKRRLIHLLVEWALVFYYRGDFKGLNEVFSSHEDFAADIDDHEAAGMFFAWLGFALYFRGEVKSSHQYLLKALEIGEKTGNQRVIGYACCWLPFTCATLDLLNEAITYGERAHEIAKILTSDQYLYFKSLTGLGFTYWGKGEGEKALVAGKTIMDYSKRHANIRSTFAGHWVVGLGHLAKGDFQAAIESLKTAAQIAKDPFYLVIAKYFLVVSYIMSEQFDQADDVVKEVLTYSQTFGCELFGNMAIGLQGVVMIVQGHMAKGLSQLEAVLRTFRKKGCTATCGMLEYILGKIYCQIATGPKPAFSVMAKNLGFLVKNVPLATQKAEEHLNHAHEISKKIGAKGFLGKSCLQLGLLYDAKKKPDRARDCISEAIQIFEATEAEGFLKQAREAMESLND